MSWTTGSGEVIPAATADADIFTGTADPDNANGLEGHDTLYGLDGDDSLDGGDGNDSLVGGDGVDTLAGGAGEDTAFYAGLIQDYYVATASNGITYVLDYYGSGAFEFLTGIETLVFADGVIVVPLPPVADADGPYAVDEDGTLTVDAANGVLAGDFDLRGEDIYAELVNAPLRGSLDLLTDGAFVYTPYLHFNGTDTFTYLARNSSGLPSQPITVTIEVASINDAPIAVQPLADRAAYVGATVNFVVPADTFYDADAGDVGTFSATFADGSALPGWLTYDAATGRFSGTPQAGDLGSLTVRVTSTDTAGAVGHDDFTFTVAPPSGAQRYVYTATDALSGRELWVTDGSLAGTAQLLDINPGAGDGMPDGFTALGDGRVLFWADDGVTGNELWVTDATVAGTFQVRDIHAGVQGSGSGSLTALGDGRAVFVTNDGSGPAVWVTDGNDASMVVALAEGGLTEANNLTALGAGRAIFTGYDEDAGREVWITDGTSAGTFRIADINPGTGNSDALNFTIFAPGRALFTANDGVTGPELWMTDGTEAGTFLVKDIRAGSTGSSATLFTPLGDGRFVFRANDGVVGPELWVTDGTEAGTALFADVTLGSAFVLPYPGPTFLTPTGDGRVIFRASVPAGGAEPWVSDGTPEGTFQLADITPGFQGSQPALFTGLGDGRFLFTAGTSALGTLNSFDRELWVTNGEAGGTSLVLDINTVTPTSGSGISGLTSIGGGRAIFSASDGLGGRELWVTDGTALGTYQVFDAFAGFDGSIPSGFTPAGTVGLNTAPTLAIPIADTAAIEDAPFTLVLDAGAFTDPDAGDTLTLSASLANGTPLPTWLTFDAAAHTFSGTPGNNDVGVVAIRVTATDAAGATAVDVFTLTIANTNDAPEIDEGVVDRSATVGIPFAYDLASSAFVDVDAGDTLAYSATLATGAALPAWLSFDAVTRTFSGTPGASDAGTIEVRVTATDVAGAAVADDFIIEVAAVPSAPTGLDLSANAVAENSAIGTVIGVLTAQDLNVGDTFAFTLIDDPDSVFALDGDRLVVGGVLDHESAEAHQVVIRVTDSAGLSFDRAFTVTVADVRGALITGTAGADFISDLNTVAGQPRATNEEDTINAGNGNDVVDGAAGADLLNGGSGADTMSGGLGADTLDGGTSGDSMVGGDGDDLYVVDSATDAVVETGGEGTDTVQTSVTHTLVDEVEVLVLTGVANTGATGNALDNTIVGSDGNNLLVGLVGADFLIGGSGSDTASYTASAAGVSLSLLTGLGVGGDAEGDTLVGIENLTGSAFDDLLEGDGGDNLFAGGAGLDTVMYGQATSGVTINLGVTSVQATGGAGTDRVSAIENLRGSAFNDALTGSGAGNAIDGAAGDDSIAGGAGADTLDGGDGDDRLDGGTSGDLLIGGAGNDFYIVDATADLVIESMAGGADTVQASVSHVLAAEVEVLILTGNATIQGTGNALDNVIHGNDSANLLAGLGGADLIDGGAGSDTLSYAAAAAGVTVSLATGAGAGSDAQGDVLINIENLTGSAFNDLMAGDTGDNVLAGGAGIDTLTYLAGASSGVIVNLALTTLQDTGGAGIDRVSGFENLIGTIFADTLAGSAAANILDGGEGRDSLLGGGGVDTLYGGAEADTLNGGTSGDLMAGGLGDDVYVVDSTADIVSEATDGGSDTVFASLSHGLGAAIEGLVLTGVGNISGTGNALANSIIGNDGGNLLAGLGGADLLDGAGGLDTVSYAASTTGVDVSLATGLGSGGDAAGDTLVRIEHVTGSAFDDRIEGDGGDNVLAGGLGTDWVSYANAAGPVSVSLAVTVVQATGAGADRLTGFENLAGSTFGDLLTGSTGANAIDGAAGDDTIIGGSGADTLTGGTGADTFRWLATTNSPVATPDVVADFDGSMDLLDVSAIDASTGLAGNQTFLFGGQTSAVLANAVTWHEVGGVTIVQGDVNGNTVADFIIRIEGAGHMLVASDFIL